MLKRAIVLLIAAASVGIAVPAAAQCLPFAIGAVCGRAEKPRFNVDFGAKEFKASQPARPRTPPEAPSRIRLSHRPQAIDCLMVKRPDAGTDPGLVTTPPATGQHTLRVLTVPSCSDNK